METSLGLEDVHPKSAAIYLCGLGLWHSSRASVSPSFLGGLNLLLQALDGKIAVWLWGAECSTQTQRATPASPLNLPQLLSPPTETLASTPRSLQFSGTAKGKVCTVDIMVLPGVSSSIFPWPLELSAPFPIHL